MVCNIQNEELGCVNAATSNDGGDFGSAWDLIKYWGNHGDVNCIYCYEVFNHWGTVPANQYGWDLCYGAINQILYPNNNIFSDWNICSTMEMVNEAPSDGPYCHASLMQSNTDYSLNNWGACQRFMDGPMAQADGDDGLVGNYNGLDYMLFYNLYCIMSERYNQYLTTPTYLPPGCNVFATFPGPVCCECLNNEGYNNNPYYFTTTNCTPIYDNQLTVQNNGGFVIQGGVNSFIDLNPTSGNIIVNSGGYFDAICNQTCCEIPSTNPYIYEPQDSHVQYNSPTKSDSSLNPPPYKPGIEFTLHPNENKILAYPNPFTSQTYIKFALKNQGPITISIYDKNDNKLLDVVKNNIYEQGSYSISLNTSFLSAGTYNCILLTRDDKKNITLVKIK